MSVFDPQGFVREPEPDRAAPHTLWWCDHCAVVVALHGDPRVKRPPRCPDCHRPGAELVGPYVMEDAAAPAGVSTIREARCACGHRERISSGQVFHVLEARGWRIDGDVVVCPWCVAKENKP